MWQPICAKTVLKGFLTSLSLFSVQSGNGFYWQMVKQFRHEWWVCLRIERTKAMWSGINLPAEQDKCSTVHTISYRILSSSHNMFPQIPNSKIRQVHQAAHIASVDTTLHHTTLHHTTPHTTPHHIPPHTTPHPHYLSAAIPTSSL